MLGSSNRTLETHLPWCGGVGCITHDTNWTGYVGASREMLPEIESCLFRLVAQKLEYLHQFQPSCSTSLD